MQVHNRLSQIRNQRGWSAPALAEKVGVKRQTIYAIEAQKYMPNTLLALRLALVLDVIVEELFSINAESAASEKPTPVHLLANETSAGRPDSLVRLCQVGSRMIGIPSAPISAGLPAADAVVVGSDTRGRTLVHAFHDLENEGNRLIVAGCDPAMPVLARHMFKHGNIELIPVGCSSLQALKWLKDRKIHVAGTHLHDESPGGSNRRVIERFFSKGGIRVVTFASWEEGLVVARTNPKSISGLSDLTRQDVTLVNREVGAGARLLLDRSLKREGISPRNIRGYESTVGGHILAAWHVQSLRADCCIATRAAARVFGLDFISLVNERYDLVIPDHHWELPAVQIMLDSLNRASLKKELETLGGYDTSETGRMVN